MVAVLDDAIAGTRRRNRVALHLRNGTVLGERGRRLGEDDGGPVYGFTRRQCERMRQTIFDAAREDATS